MVGSAGFDTLPATTVTQNAGIIEHLGTEGLTR
jgi:hypothetical protein